VQKMFELTITARQYGEVVLPDAASGQGPGTPPEAGPENCHGARRVWRTFCRHGTNFIEHYECRGTRLIGAAKLSPVTKLVADTGAVSRYNLSRSLKFITVQDLNYGQMRVSGCNNHYKFVLSAGAKAKSVTNNLPILSVLWLVVLLYSLLKYFIQWEFTNDLGSLARIILSGEIYLGNSHDILTGVL